MSTLRVLAITLATAVVVVWAAAPALAGPPGGRGHGGPPTGQGHGAATKGDVKGDREAKSDQEAKRDQEKEQGAKSDQDKKEVDVKDEKKHDQEKTTGDKKQSDKAHAKKPSNKGRKKRGLDRADEVAGEHGKQGRENAREHAAKEAGGVGR